MEIVAVRISRLGTLPLAQVKACAELCDEAIVQLAITTQVGNSKSDLMEV